MEPVEFMVLRNVQEHVHLAVEPIRAKRVDVLARAGAVVVQLRTFLEFAFRAVQVLRATHTTRFGNVQRNGEQAVGIEGKTAQTTRTQKTTSLIEKGQEYRT